MGLAEVFVVAKVSHVIDKREYVTATEFSSYRLIPPRCQQRNH